MSSPRFPAAATLLDAKACPLEQFDALFAKITRDRQIADGYFLQAHPQEVTVLFVVNGSPYGAGRLVADRFASAEIHAFFAAYAQHPQSPLSFFVADKRLLLGLMVVFRHGPALEFPMDLVKLQEVLATLAARGADAFVSVRSGEEWAVSICAKGRLLANYFPPSGAKALMQAAPEDELLEYVDGRQAHGVTVSVYEETRVGPASDAILVTPKTRGRLSEVFLSVAARVAEEEAAIRLDRAAPAPVPVLASDASVPVAVGESPVVTTDMSGLLEGEHAAREPESAPVDVGPAATTPLPSAPPASKGPHPEVLLFLGDKHLGTFSLGQGELTIGRNPGNDILIDNVGVSRRHAVIRVHGDAVIIEDLGSANGTSVNGQKITTHELRNGDEIQVLKHHLVYRLPKEATVPRVEAVKDTGQETIAVDPAAIAQAAAGRGDAGTPKLRPRLILPDLKKLALEAEEVRLGSGEECQIQLSGMFVAKTHAKIVPEKDGQFKIVHLAGLAGTRVNGEKISERLLKHGDEITIGKQKLLFRLER